jgi:hypothetical protein
MKNFLPILSFFIFIGLAHGGTVTKKLELSAIGIKNFDIDCGAGFLNVVGVEGNNIIEVQAEVDIRGYRGDELNDFIDKYVNLSLEKSNSHAILKSHIEYRSSYRGYMQVNLTIKIPVNMNLKINDGSGLTEIKNVTGNIYIDDGSGKLSVENIKGDVEIDDGSGKISVADITGNVIINDGAGEAKITGIEGSVKVRDGSGSIYIDKVSKDVTITESGSGGLTIRNVDGKVQKND